MVGLKWDMVNLDEGTITLPTTKNKKPRTLHIAAEVLAIVKRREATRLVDGPDGEPHIAERAFHRRGRSLGDFKRACETARIEAGLPDTLFHDLRRTAVRNLRRAGVPESVAISVTGHKTRAVFDRYDIKSGGDQRKALEQISN